MTTQLNVCGLRVAVDVRGSGPPVLLINGLGGTLGLWQALQTDLAGFEVIAFDAPGVGQTATPWRIYSMADLARFVIRLLDDLGYEKVDVVGYSFGGALAQQMARDTPERIRRMALVATTCGWGGVPGSLTSSLVALIPLRLWSRRVYGMTVPWLTGGHDTDADLLRAYAAERLSAPLSIPGFYQQLIAGWTWSSLPWLTTIEHPVLVVAGGNDQLLPLANSQILAAHLPNSRLLVQEGYGHYLLLDQRSGAGEAIADFLRSEDQGGSSAWRRAHAVSHDDLNRRLRAQNRWSPIALPHAAWRRLQTVLGKRAPIAA
jgi:poly(3-hydroxyoctanoate) depolymerase